MRHLSSLCAALLLTTTLACSGDEEEGGPTPTIRAEADVTEIMSGDTVTLTFEIEHFTLSGESDHEHLELDFDPPLTAQADPFAAGEYTGPSEGHVHVYLDDLEENPLAMITTVTGEVVVEADPGAHTLICRLHGSDHKIIEPQIIDEVDLTVN